jgi:hypothetical protein
MSPPSGEHAEEIPKAGEVHGIESEESEVVNDGSSA